MLCYASSGDLSIAYQVIGDGERVLATVLFTDVVRSTERAGELGDRRRRELLDRHDAVAAAKLERFEGHTIKSLGDGLLATFDGPARTIRCACAIVDTLADLGLELRAGIHTGECERQGQRCALVKGRPRRVATVRSGARHVAKRPC